MPNARGKAEEEREAQRQSLRGLNPNSRGVESPLGLSDAVKQYIQPVSDAASGANKAATIAEKVGYAIPAVVARGLTWVGWIITTGKIGAALLEQFMSAISRGETNAYAQGVAATITFAAYGAPLAKIVPHEGMQNPRDRESFARGVAHAHKVLAQLARDSRPVTPYEYFERIYRTSMPGELARAEENLAKSNPRYFESVVKALERANDVRLSF
jgi:hypothetical protein